MLVNRWCIVYPDTYIKLLDVQMDLREKGIGTSITKGSLNKFFLHVFFKDFVYQFGIFSKICDKHNVYWEGKLKYIEDLPQFK